jgi:hypothetical protein
MTAAPRNRVLRLVPNPTSKTMIDADLVAFEVMEFIDQQYPKFWEGQPKTARVNVRTSIVRAVRSQEVKR